MNELLKALDTFFAEEHNIYEWDHSHLEHIDLTYTQSLDGEHDFQWYVNAETMQAILQVDWEDAHSIEFDSLEDMAEWIYSLSYGGLECLADNYYESHKDDPTDPWDDIAIEEKYREERGF